MAALSKSMLANPHSLSNQYVMGYSMGGSVHESARLLLDGIGMQ